MNLANDLRKFNNKLKDISLINEAKGHLDHPEDLVFIDGISGAKRAVDSIQKTIKNPKAVTIKWDGYPALIFGRGVNGKFAIMDKHMFNKKDGTGRQVFSPEQFVQYDQDRGISRPELHVVIAQIWPGLEKSDSDKGFYWGDLLFSKPLQEQDGVYKFRANPNGITYTVDVNSEVGQLLKDEVAGIAVHQYLPANAYTTDDAVPLNGTIGNLKNDSNVAIVPSKMPISPKLTLDTSLVSKTNSDINQYGPAVEDLLNNAPQARNSFSQLFTTYINKRIVSGNLSNLLDGFMDYFNKRPMTDSMRNKLNQHLENSKEGLVGIFTIWIDLYNLKMNVVEQLNKAAETSPVKGYLQNGQETQEGFVSQGLKFVDRLGFSAQNLAGR